MLPFEFRCIQFPVSLFFVMTINKSQGQTFKAVGVDMTDESFTHIKIFFIIKYVTAPTIILGYIYRTLQPSELHVISWNAVCSTI